MGNDIQGEAAHVLQANDVGGQYTRPAYHQYLEQYNWDSALIAGWGLRHIDPKRAMAELRSLMDGQWQNGMVPHMVLPPDSRFDPWHSVASKHAPAERKTSGITQPPLLSEAAVRIGQHLPESERQAWYQDMYPRVLAYHEWLYRERAGDDGLIILLDPCETGMDNTPPWMTVMQGRMPVALRTIRWLGLDKILDKVRPDARHVPAEQRMSSVEGLAIYSLEQYLRRQRYDSPRILQHPRIAVQDVGFNAILIRANARLAEMAEAIGEHLPDYLRQQMEQTVQGLEALWDEATGLYYSRSVSSGSDYMRRLNIPTSASLLPLYAGTIKSDRAARLVEALRDRALFNTPYPIPSVAVSSPWFDPIRYWQGPTWANINVLVADGLARYGYNDEASDLRKKTLQMIRTGGMSEYFNPYTSSGLGANMFSWTAAMAVELLNLQGL